MASSILRQMGSSVPSCALFRAGIVSVRNASSGGNKPVGFIGCGNMGNYMATNLLNKGQSLVVYDIQSAATSSLEKLGAKVVKTPADLASQVDKLITMLPACAHVKQVYEGPNGIFKGAKPGSFFLDSSTIDPETCKYISEGATAVGSTFLDCPVSGGVIGAKAGTLTFMVGGPQNKLQEVESLLLGMGSRVVHCGGTGMGQAAKICNNMLLAITMIGTAETMNLGIRMGLDAKLLTGIINSSTGRNWSSELYNPVPGILENVPSSNDYKGGFGTGLITKDLGLSQNLATGSATPIPMGALSYQIYQIMCTRGYKDKDFSSVFQFLQNQESQ